MHKRSPSYLNSAFGGLFSIVGILPLATHRANAQPQLCKFYDQEVTSEQRKLKPEIDAWYQKHLDLGSFNHGNTEIDAKPVIGKYLKVGMAYCLAEQILNLAGIAVDMRATKLIPESSGFRIINSDGLETIGGWWFRTHYFIEVSLKISGDIDTGKIYGFTSTLVSNSL